MLPGPSRSAKWNPIWIYSCGVSTKSNSGSSQKCVWPIRSGSASNSCVNSSNWPPSKFDLISNSKESGGECEMSWRIQDGIFQRLPLSPSVSQRPPASLSVSQHTDGRCAKRNGTRFISTDVRRNIWPCGVSCSCKEFQNLNAFFALVMGLSNVAVSRLTQTWERLPSKLRKMFTEFDSLIEPSRNHRAYRIAVGKLQPPIIPFMPLLLKGTLTFKAANQT